LSYQQTLVYQGLHFNFFPFTSTLICGLYYKPITIVNDDSSIVSELEASLIDDAIVVIYDHHMFIVQGTDASAFMANLLSRGIAVKITTLKSFIVPALEDSAHLNWTGVLAFGFPFSELYLIKLSATCFTFFYNKLVCFYVTLIYILIQ
jgi:hypothetical protein